MRPTSASASRFSRLFPAAATLLFIACNETTTPPVPTKLGFTVQPVATTAGMAISPAVAVAVQDEAGNTVTAATNIITVAIETNPPNGTLTGIATVAAVNGIATFSDLRINKVGTGYTLSAASPNLTNATSLPFGVVVGPSARLAFTAQPVNTIARTTIPSFTVAVQDAAGNTIASATNDITLQIGVNPGSGSLSGTTTVRAVSGVATFSDVSISNPGIGYTLIAAASNLTGVTSTAFNMTVGSAAKLAFTVQPAATHPAGATITPAVAVVVQDVGGNTVTTATNSITVAIGTNAGSGTLSGTTTVAAVNGVATFTNLSIDNLGAGYTLTAAAANLTGTTSAAFSIRNPLSFAMVTAGYFHTCGVTTGGVAYCWGGNSFGELGNPAWSDSNVPVEVSGGLTFAKVVAGRSHTCGVNTGGIAYCWGASESGRLGTTGSQNGVPQTVSGSLTFAVASAGYAHSCGVTTGGGGYCWGDNSTGALGNASQTQSNVPVAVSGVLTFASISPGRYFTCGVTTAGAAHCWGANFSGELGDGTTVQRTSPVPVSGQLNFAIVSAGGFHACGLTTGGLAYCWGWNAYGELGNGAGSSSSIPVAVSGGLTFAALSAGNRHTCGVTTGGVAYCWGDNSSGHLGNGTTTSSSLPVTVSGGHTFASVSAGRFHTCGVTTGGAAYCWGGSSLGDGTTTFSLVPVPVR